MSLTTEPAHEEHYYVTNSKKRNQVGPIIVFALHALTTVSSGKAPDFRASRIKHQVIIVLFALCGNRLNVSNSIGHRSTLLAAAVFLH